MLSPDTVVGEVCSNVLHGLHGVSVIEDGLQEGEAAGLVEQNRVGGEGGLHTHRCTKLGQIKLHIPLGYRLGQDRSLF